MRDLVLEVVTPAGLELSVRAAQECERERATLDRQWRLRLERAAQEANRAFRQYNAVEPENRLVARTLERTWEEALLAQRALEEEYHRFQKAQPMQLSAAERAQIETLARNLPTLWQASQTSMVEKRQIVRWLLQRVVVWAPASTQEVTVQLHWTYGTVTEHRITRPVHAWKHVTGAKDLWQRVTRMANRRLDLAAHSRGIEQGGLSNTAWPTLHSRKRAKADRARWPAGGRNPEGDRPTHEKVDRRRRSCPEPPRPQRSRHDRSAGPPPGTPTGRSAIS